MRSTALALLLLAGCGAASPRPATEADFVAIARAEARQDAAFGRLRQARTPGERVAAAKQTCSAAASLCEAAEPLDDHDARARCRIARARCRDARAEAEAGPPREAP